MFQTTDTTSNQLKEVLKEIPPLNKRSSEEEEFKETPPPPNFFSGLEAMQLLLDEKLKKARQLTEKQKKLRDKGRRRKKNERELRKRKFGSS